MKFLLDTNVILDVLLDRQTHSTGSRQIWNLIERRNANGLLAAHALTTIDSLISKSSGRKEAKQTLGLLLSVFGIAAVDEMVLRSALQLDWQDFEDAVTAASAAASGCDGIVTRDLAGFRKSRIRVLTPEAAAAVVRQQAASK